VRVTVPVNPFDGTTLTRSVLPVVVPALRISEGDWTEIWYEGSEIVKLTVEEAEDAKLESPEYTAPMLWFPIPRVDVVKGALPEERAIVPSDVVPSRK
jgi:hypothetical protein